MIEYSTYENWILTKVPYYLFNYQILNKQILLFTGIIGSNIAEFINIQIFIDI